MKDEVRAVGEEARAVWAVGYVECDIYTVSTKMKFGRKASKESGCKMKETMRGAEVLRLI